ncbi:MAG: hypothetical protein WC479_12590 [Candidatus Izemoplasmatales bacterium]
MTLTRQYLRYPPPPDLMKDVDSVMDDCRWRSLDCKSCPLAVECWQFYDRLEDKHIYTEKTLARIKTQWAELKARITETQDNRTNDKIEQFMKGKA